MNNTNHNTNNPDVNQEKVAKEEIYPADTTQQSISDQAKTSDKPDNATKTEQGTSRKRPELDVPEFFSNPRRTSKKVPMSSQTKKVQKAIKKAVLKSANKVLMPNKIIKISTIVLAFLSISSLYLFASGDAFIALVCSAVLFTFVSMGFQIIENSYYKRICKQLEVDGLLKAICLSDVRPHIIDKELSLNELHRRDKHTWDSFCISVHGHLIDLPNAKHRNTCLEAWNDFENAFEEFLLRKQQEELTAGRPLF